MRKEYRKAPQKQAPQENTRPARPAPKCCVNRPDLDPKKPGDKLLPQKKCTLSRIKNAINERQKKKTKAPENRKRQSPKVLLNSPKPRRDTGSPNGKPHQIPASDSPPTQTESHKPSAKKSRLASLGKRLIALARSLLKTGRASPAPAARRGGTRSIATRGYNGVAARPQLL
jgi:hypothetical protein